MTPQPSPESADEELIAAARAALEHAYSPYSGFRVGAAVRTAGGAIVAGSNVENASYSLTLCAERSAAAAAISGGARALAAVAVATETAEPVLPCGACRQFLAEFGPELRVVCVGSGPRAVVTSLGELLPGRFVLPRD